MLITPVAHLHTFLHDGDQRHAAPEPVHSISIFTPASCHTISDGDLRIHLCFICECFLNILDSPAQLFFSFSPKMYLWDWIMSIPEEIRMCRQRNFAPAMVVYFLSRWEFCPLYCYQSPLWVLLRIGTLAYCATVVVSQGCYGLWQAAIILIFKQPDPYLIAPSL